MYSGLAALGPKTYIGRAASGTEMYLGLPALSYRVVPRAGSPMSPGLAALGPEKYIGQDASITEMYLRASSPQLPSCTKGLPPLV